MRKAFTITELFVSLGIIAILAGLLLPAIQAARESARSTSCASKLRQWGIAVQNFEAANKQLPGPSFNAPMNSGDYHWDRGLFLHLLDYVENPSLSYEFPISRTTFHPENYQALTSRVPLLVCPSNVDPALLTDISEQFSGPAKVGLNSLTCDYTGNSGFAVAMGSLPSTSNQGPIQVKIGGLKPSVRMANVLDGLSNTFLLWESVGSYRFVVGKSTPLPIDSHVARSFQLKVGSTANLVFSSLGEASSKSYLHSWAGLRIGNIVDFGGRSINVDNSRSGPFSLHGTGCHFVLSDGSTRFVSDSTTPSVLFACATLAGGESAQVDL